MSDMDVVPFGKYKDQPIAMLAQDHQYLDWLMQQSWFKDRYQKVYNIIINNFKEPSNTPEHNKLQAMFLDDEFVKQVIHYSFDLYSLETYSQHFECKGWDCKLEFSGHAKDLSSDHIYYHKDRFGRDVWLWYPDTDRGSNIADSIKVVSSDEVVYGKSTFVFSGEEVQVRKMYAGSNGATETITHARYTRNYHEQIDGQINIKLKPQVSDDYPEILRTLKNRQSTGVVLLITQSYTGIGATLEQVKKMYAISGIKFLLLEEIIG